MLLWGCLKCLFLVEKEARVAELLLYLIDSAFLIVLFQCLNGLSKYSWCRAFWLAIKNNRLRGEIARYRPSPLLAFLLSKHSSHHLEVLLELLQAVPSLVLQNEFSQLVKFILQYAVLLSQPVIAAQQLQYQRCLGSKTIFIKIKSHVQG